MDGWMDVDGIDSTIQKNKSAVYWTRPRYIIIISITLIVSYLLKLNQIIITIWLYSWYFVINFLLYSNLIPLYYTFIYISSILTSFGSLWFFFTYFIYFISYLLSNSPEEYWLFDIYGFTFFWIVFWIELQSIHN